MAKSFAGKIKLTGYDELFGGDASGRCDAQLQEIPLRDLRPFAHHPFKVRDDEDMAKLTESIKDYGIFVPALVRPHPDGGYEILSGHRRAYAANKAGLTMMPAIVREIDDDEAVIAMVDANLQREKILPSEKAFSYKMKLEALKHQGKRRDLEEQSTSDHRDQKLGAREKVALDAGESGPQIQRYIRLTELNSDLLEKTDAGVIGLRQGVEFSYLNTVEQKSLNAVICDLEVHPSTAQASKIRALSKEHCCTKEAIYAVLREEPTKPRQFVIKSKKLAEYFPENVSDDVIERTIFELLDKWKAQTGG